MKDADKTARAAIKTLQTQVQRASTRADVNSVLKRIDGLTRQARQIARGAAGARATATRTRRPATRRAATTRGKKTAAARRATTPGKTTTPRKPAATVRAAKAPRRAATPRRRRAARTATPEPAEVIIPVAEIDQVEVYEITEP